MTASILLRIGALDSKNDYTKNHSKVKHKFEKCAICHPLSLNAQRLKRVGCAFFLYYNPIGRR